MKNPKTECLVALLLFLSTACADSEIGQPFADDPMTEVSSEALSIRPKVQSELNWVTESPYETSLPDGAFADYAFEYWLYRPAGAGRGLLTMETCREVQNGGTDCWTAVMSPQQGQNFAPFGADPMNYELGENRTTLTLNLRERAGQSSVTLTVIVNVYEPDPDWGCASNADCDEGLVCIDNECGEACVIFCLVPDLVCGTDSVTYRCGPYDAACNGVDVAYEGECVETEAWRHVVGDFYVGSLPFLVPSEPPDRDFLEGQRLARWMMPYSAEDDFDQDVEELAATILDSTDLVVSSFERPALDRFFTGRMAPYISEILVSAPSGEQLLNRLVENSCQAVIDQFGELTSDNPPFENSQVAAGLALPCEMEAVTTLPIWYLTDHAIESDAPMPAFLLPLYERYLVQHEFAHVFHFNQGRRILYEEQLLSQVILDLYEDAKTDGLLLSCYGETDEYEFFAEATAIYFSPIPVASLNGGVGNGECDRGLTPEARAIVEDAGPGMSGAELIEELHSDLAKLLEFLFGEAHTYHLVR